MARPTVPKQFLLDTDLVREFEAVCEANGLVQSRQVGHMMEDWVDAHKARDGPWHHDRCVKHQARRVKNCKNCVAAHAAEHRPPKGMRRNWAAGTVFEIDGGKRQPEYVNTKEGR